jgi:alpha-mannosidase
MVYDDAEKYYAEVKKDGEALLEDAFKVLFPHGSRALGTGPSDGTLLAYNSTFLPRREVVRVAAGAALAGQLAQTGADGAGYALLDAPEGATLARPIGMFADCMPVSGTSCAASVRAVCAAALTPGSVHERDGPPDHAQLERAAHDREGPHHEPPGREARVRCSSACRAAAAPYLLGPPRRELIPEGSTGGLVIFEDRPNYWDAWGAARFRSPF